MYEPRDYRIDVVSDSLRPTRVRIDIADIGSLPAALRNLAAMGYDLTDAHKALTEAVEEQRRRKALDEAVKGMAKPAE